MTLSRLRFDFEFTHSIACLIESKFQNFKLWLQHQSWLSWGKITSSWFFFYQSNVFKQLVLASRLLFLSSTWIPGTNNCMQALHFKYYFLLCASKTRPGYKQTIQSQSQQSNNHKLMNILTCRYCCSHCQSHPIFVSKYQQVLWCWYRLVTFIFGLWTVQTELYKNVGKETWDHVVSAWSPWRFCLQKQHAGWISWWDQVGTNYIVFG